MTLETLYRDVLLGRAVEAAGRIDIEHFPGGPSGINEKWAANDSWGASQTDALLALLSGLGVTDVPELPSVERVAEVREELVNPRFGPTSADIACRLMLSTMKAADFMLAAALILPREEAPDA